MRAAAMNPLKHENLALRMHPGWFFGLLLAFPGLSVVVGLLAAPLARWLLNQIFWSPNILRLLSHADDDWGLIVLVSIGSAVGLGVATTAKKETGTIRFDDAGITITRNGQMRWLSDAYMGHFTPWLDGRPELSAELTHSYGVVVRPWPARTLA